MRNNEFDNEKFDGAWNVVGESRTNIIPRRFGDEIDMLVQSVKLMSLSNLILDENKGKSINEMSTEILTRMKVSAEATGDDKAVADFENAIARLSTFD